jgi:hypothetical protein
VVKKNESGHFEKQNTHPHKLAIMFFKMPTLGGGNVLGL